MSPAAMCSRARAIAARCCSAGVTLGVVTCTAPSGRAGRDSRARSRSHARTSSPIEPRRSARVIDREHRVVARECERRTRARTRQAAATAGEPGVVSDVADPARHLAWQRAHRARLSLAPPSRPRPARCAQAHANGSPSARAAHTRSTGSAATNEKRPSACGEAPSSQHNPGRSASRCTSEGRGSAGSNGETYMPRG